MKEVWKAPATGSGMTRTPLGGFAANCARASSGPAATICPPPLTLAPTRSSSARVARTVSVSPPISADIPVGVNAQAALIAVPRTAARSTASSAGNTPASDAAASSPTECPAMTAPAGIVQMLGGQQGGGDHQRLGDRGVLDLVRLCGGSQPDEVEVGPVRHGGGSITDTVQLEPTAQHSGLLGSRPGAQRWPALT